jgi:hypothetical protein
MQSQDVVKWNATVRTILMNLYNYQLPTLHSINKMIDQIWIEINHFFPISFIHKTQLFNFQNMLLLGAG